MKIIPTNPTPSTSLSFDSHVTEVSFKNLPGRNGVLPSSNIQGFKGFADELRTARTNRDSLELRSKSLLGGRTFYGVAPSGQMKGNLESTNAITSQMAQFAQLLEKQTALQLKHQETSAKSNIIHVLQEGKKGVIQGIRGVN